MAQLESPDRFLWLLGSVVIAVIILFALLYLNQRRLIYFPLDQIVPPVSSLLPGGEEISFRTDDGLDLKGWFIPAKENKEEPTAVLVLNGNAGNRSYRTPLAAALSEAGFSVLLFDYRGYGGNPGNPTEMGLIADSQAARRYLVSRPDVDRSRIVYFGESLGAALAVGLAAEEPPAALILRSPFTSLTDVGRCHYSFLPVRLFLKDTYPSTDRIGKVRSPILVIAGGRDTIIPISQSRRLYDLAPARKRFVEVPGADHNDFELLAGERMIGEMVRFVREALPPSASGPPEKS